jgi:hypothetical protein
MSQKKKSKSKATTSESPKTKPVHQFDDHEDDVMDPMEEAFDNMKHPMELMLLNRACIPYVAN